MPSIIPRMPTPDSSQVAEWGYCPVTQKLAVKFKSSPDRVYEYKGVKPEVAEGMEKAESKGAFLYKHIKPVHDFERFEEDKPVAADSEGGTAD